MNIKDRLYNLIPIIIISFLFRKYAAPYLVSDERELVQKYLYNENYSNIKPYLWVYVPQDDNSRKWSSFNERKTNNLNTPYIEYTLNTILNKNKDFFNVCVISDNDFVNLIPKWDYEIDSFSGQNKDRIRELAKQKILYYYGGLFVPPSFLCKKSLRSLYEFSDINSFKIYCDKYESIYGSKKYNEQVKKYISDLETYVKTPSIEVEFEDSINRSGDEYLMQLDGKLIGTKDKYDKVIDLNELLGESSISFDNSFLGIYIPRIDIQNSVKYGWFQRETVMNISNSSIYIAKYFK
tara:strand:+ start:11493 stop:12374 length:882 start_codon:yes stop_codon:yes gene_type:complete